MEQPSRPVDRVLPLVWLVVWVGFFLFLQHDARSWGPPIRGSCWGLIEQATLSLIHHIEQPYGVALAGWVLALGAFPPRGAPRTLPILRAWWVLGSLSPVLLVVAVVGMFHPGAWGSWGRDPDPAYALVHGGLLLAVPLGVGLLWRTTTILRPGAAPWGRLLTTGLLAALPLGATAVAFRFRRALPWPEPLAVSIPVAATLTACGISAGLWIWLERDRPAGAPA